MKVLYIVKFGSFRMKSFIKQLYSRSFSSLYKHMQLLLTFLAVIVMCPAVWADEDAGLYDPVAPEGSAFVRFFNLTGGDITPKANGKAYNPLGKGEVSPYFVVPEGAIISGDIKEDALAGEFYTVINPKNIWIQDMPNTNRAKATIALYNLSDQPMLMLKAKDGEVMVLDDVKKDSAKARDMNAVKIDFSIYNGDEHLLTLPSQVIERGNHYSIFYDGVTADFVTAKTNIRG